MAGAALLLLGIIPVPANAACTVSTQAVAFGTYLIWSPTPTDGVGNIHVACGVPTNFIVALGRTSAPGYWPSSDDRWLRPNGNGTQAVFWMRYNFYTDASRVTIWGDGIEGTTVSGSGTSVDMPVYGRIGASQTSKPAGPYSDMVTVTVTF